MIHFALKHPWLFSISIYSISILPFLFWQWVFPGEPVRAARLPRWRSNLALLTINVATNQILTTVTIASLAYIAWKNGWGLLNLLHLPAGISFGASLLALDGFGYFQHRFFHKFGWTWSFHRVHHADLDMDATTGQRFHFFENLFSLLVRQGVILTLGPSPLAVVVYDAGMLLSSFFSHGNIWLPEKIGKALGWILVTPRIHRVHHFTKWKESNSNFGVVFSFWDRFFKTFHREAAEGSREKIGLPEFRSTRALGFFRLLIFPFLRKGGNRA